MSALSFLFRAVFFFGAANGRASGFVISRMTYQIQFIVSLLVAPLSAMTLTKLQSKNLT